MQTKLERLLKPRSIAAIGGLQAQRVIEQCRLMGYEGAIWPVHPDRKEVAGLAAYQSVEALPASPDAVFIGVNRELTIEIVRSLRTIDAGGVICYASGFLELDEEGGRLQAELLEAAGDMPLLGPNCYGLINYADGALLWPDQQGGKRLEPGQKGVAIITQSSNIALNFSMQARGLPVAYIMTVGNQAQIGLSELASCVLDDSRVTCLGLHIEGFDSIHGMELLAAKARSLGKPVVVLKVGKSEQAQAATLSHTASLAGPHSAANAFLKRFALGQAQSIPVFLEALKLLHVTGPLSGYRLSSMSCSGGEASLIADTAVEKKVHFPSLDKNQKITLEKALGPRVSVANPLDYHTYCWGDGEAMTKVYRAMIGGQFDYNLLLLDFPLGPDCDDGDWLIAAKSFIHALEESAAKGALVVSMQENISLDHTDLFIQNGVPCLYGFDEALRAIEIAATIGQAWRDEPADSLLTTVTSPIPAAKKKILDEATAKQRLNHFQIPIPSGQRVNTVQQAVDSAQAIGYPVVLKALGMAHKTEHNALRLNLTSGAAIADAAKALLRVNEELYVEKMIEGVVGELIIGIIRDSLYGFLMTLGSGGIYTEILRDSKTLLLPVERSDIEMALLDLKTAPVLAGYRGQPGADIKAAVDAIIAIQEYALDESEHLLELDVNPLLVCEKGRGVCAADVLIVLQEESNHD